jgi:hypothetical protein
VRPYSRNLCDDGTHDWAAIQIACIPHEVFIFHGDELRAPDFSTGDDVMTSALRFACHLLIDRIDKRGLKEACESLAEFYEYYRPREDAQVIPTEVYPLNAFAGDEPVIRRVFPAVEERSFRVSEE